MKQEYKLKEVFDEKSKNIDEKLIEVFVNFLIEKVNKQFNASSSMCFAYQNQFFVFQMSCIIL